jgi:hypothetical protein
MNNFISPELKTYLILFIIIIALVFLLVKKCVFENIQQFTDYISAHVIELDERKTDDINCPYGNFYKTDGGLYCADGDYIYGCSRANNNVNPKIPNSTNTLR